MGQFGTLSCLLVMFVSYSGECLENKGQPYHMSTHPMNTQYVVWLYGPQSTTLLSWKVVEPFPSKHSNILP